MLQRLSPPLFLPHLEPESGRSNSSTTGGDVDVEGHQGNDSCEIKAVEAAESLPDLTLTMEEDEEAMEVEANPEGSIEKGNISEQNRRTPIIGCKVKAIENDDGRLDEAKLLENETSDVKDQEAEGLLELASMRRRRFSIPEQIIAVSFGAGVFRLFAFINLCSPAQSQQTV